MRVFTCFLHFPIIISIVIYTALQICFYIFLSAKKRQTNNNGKTTFPMSNAAIAYLINSVLFFTQFVTYCVIEHCWFCTVLLILNFFIFIALICFFFFRKQIIDLLLKQSKKIKNEAKKAKRVQKLNAIKNRIEFEDEAATFNDSFNIAPSIKESTTISLKDIYEKVKAIEGCEFKRNDGLSGGEMINECVNFYATVKSNKGKIIRSRFAIVYDFKKDFGAYEGRAIVLFLKVDPMERKFIFEHYSNSCVSKYPIGSDFISFPLDESIANATCVDFMTKAHKYVTNCLEEKEFEKASKKLRV